MSEEVKMNSTAPEVKSILVVSAHNTDWIWALQRDCGPL